MGKHHEHPVPVMPAKRTAAVTSRLAECRRILAALEGQRAAAAVASAVQEPGATEALGVLCRRILETEFEIASSVKAEALASAEDREAAAEWVAQIQRLPIDVLLAGISRDQCAGLCCSSGSLVCVISSGDPTSGGNCSHPVLERGPHPNHADHPQVKAVYVAACQKLNVRPRI